MKTKTNPAAIGIFIAGAIVLLFASLVIFGGGRFFRKTKELLLTFREPTTGLDVGAPVKLMGVTVGSVKAIHLAAGNDATNALLINVIIQIDLEGSQRSFQGYEIDLGDRTRFESLVELRGLRGQLEMLSLLSGQLYIDLELFPGQAGFRLNRVKEHGLWEIPTLPSTKRQMMNSLMVSLENFTKFDVKGTSDDLRSLLAELRTDLASMQLGRLGTNATATLQAVEKLVDNPQLRSAITNLDAALAQVNELGGKLNTRMNPLLAEAEGGLKKAGAAFDEATRTLRQLQTQVEPGSTLSRELVRTLEEAGAALNALRELAQEIQQNPSALITGKKVEKP